MYLFERRKKTNIKKYQNIMKEILLNNFPISKNRQAKSADGKQIKNQCSWFIKLSESFDK